ncbi:MAG: hypothetical protein E7297_01500 [Lachnospiraceae bacterium]|jgi:hypothetical protein|nr:hypothetical protein [Lachnospiraceae bacterium]
MNEQTDKITKYKKPHQINIGMIIFGALFVYIVICLILYFNTKHLRGYEVKTGSLSEDNIYRGIALREEHVVNATAAGYIYYFVPEGTHVSTRDVVYALDSAGNLSDAVTYNTSTATLSNQDLNDLKGKLTTYQSYFGPHDFQTVYDLKKVLNSEIVNLSNKQVLNSLESMDSLSSGVTKYAAGASGDVAFYIDGYEDLKPEDITMDHFDETAYAETSYSGNSLVGNGDAVYKIIPNEDWSVVIHTSNAKAQELSEEGYVLVKFMKDQFKTYGKVKVLSSDADNDISFVQLTFSNSMVDYISDRFLDVELILEEKEGLKIPNSSIVEKNFFLIPKEYMVKGKGGKDGVMRQTFTEKNEQTTEFVTTTIYSEDKDKYYVDQDVLNAGDVIFLPDSTETFTVSEQASLVGVFNINKGYADFRKIIILYQNDDYAIVKSDTMYGLNNYDYIALDAATVKDDQFVYE